MFRNRLGLFIAIIIVLAGCGNNATQPESANVYQGEALDGIAKVAWEYGEFQSPQLEASVTEEAAYVGDQHNLYAIDSKTGKKKWTYEVTGRLSRPAAADGVVSFLDNSGVHVLDAESGALLWEHLNKMEIPHELRPVITTVSDDHVFVNERLDDGRVTLKALDIKTGQESWNFGDEISLTRAPAVSGDKLYIASQMTIHILKEKTGKELDSIEHEAIIDNVAIDNKQLVVSDIVGGVTAYDLNSKELKWSYKNDAFDLKNRPHVILFGNKVLLTEVRSRIVVMLDAGNGKVLWNKTLGNPAFSNLYGGAITKPIVSEDRVYLAVFEGQHKEQKGFAGHSAIMSMDATTGNELWRYQEDDYIYDIPGLIENGMVVVTKNGLKAYLGGEQTQSTTTLNEQEGAEHQLDNDGADLNSFEGQWSTPGSDELAFKLTLTDNSGGLMTFYSEGEENPTPFQYVISGHNQLMLKLGKDETPTILRLNDKDQLVFKTNTLNYTLERSGVSQTNKEGANLISGFNGKWCDSIQALCFEVKLEGDSGGTLDYYQEREPFQETFRITYMDEYRIVIKVNDSKQTELELSDDKNILTYKTDSSTETMTRQD